MENYYVKQDFGSGGGGNRWEMNEMIVKRSFVAPTSVLAKPVAKTLNSKFILLMTYSPLRDLFCSDILFKSPPSSQHLDDSKDYLGKVVHENIA